MYSVPTQKILDIYHGDRFTGYTYNRAEFAYKSDKAANSQLSPTRVFN